MAFSDFVQGWAGSYPAVLIGTPCSSLALQDARRESRLMDRIFLRDAASSASSSEARHDPVRPTLSALLNAGVDVGSSLDLAADVVILDPFRRAVRDTRYAGHSKGAS